MKSMLYGLGIALLSGAQVPVFAAIGDCLKPTAKVQPPQAQSIATVNWFASDQELTAEVSIRGELHELSGLKKANGSVVLTDSPPGPVSARGYCVETDCSKVILDVLVEESGYTLQQQFASSDLAKMTSVDPDETGEFVGAPPLEDELDREKQIGPWLDLKGGGIAAGPSQGLEGGYGVLENASQVPASSEGILRLSRGGNHSSWGTGFMISLLENAAAEYTRTHLPGHILYVGAISQASGGLFPPHKSHQNGLDADLLFIGAKNYRSVLDPDGSVSERFDKARNWEFWRMLTAQRIIQDGKEIPVVSMILVSPPIKQALCVWAQAEGLLNDPANVDLMKRIRPTEGHDAHFHVRLHCSPHHPLCKKQWDPGRREEMGC